MEPLALRTPGEVSMYLCGPTVYDFSHVGHARTYIAYDVLKRVLLQRGLRVVHVQNFTDMEESIRLRAEAEGVDPFRLAERFLAAYLEDMASLRVLPATRYPRASEHVGLMVDAAKRLLDEGVAYVDGPDVRFDASKAPRFGHLVGSRLEDLVVERPPVVDRRSPVDFALWRCRDDWGVTFPSPWGPGRPGWHVECAVMSTASLGAGFDLHGGGLDLVFPHHESEAAIAETLFGAPFARHWMHTGFVTVGAAKMSKSKGNFVTIRDALARHDGEALRAFLLSAPYAETLEFGFEELAASERRVRRWNEVARALAKEGHGAPHVADAAADCRVRFAMALDDDLAVHRAIQHLDACATAAEGATGASAAGALGVLREMGDALGLLWSVTEPAPNAPP